MQRKKKRSKSAQIQFLLNTHPQLAQPLFKQMDQITEMNPDLLRSVSTARQLPQGRTAWEISLIAGIDLWRKQGYFRKYLLTTWKLEPWCCKFTGWNQPRWLQWCSAPTVNSGDIIFSIARLRCGCETRQGSRFCCPVTRPGCAWMYLVFISGGQRVWRFSKLRAASTTTHHSQLLVGVGVLVLPICTQHHLSSFSLQSATFALLQAILIFYFFFGGGGGSVNYFFLKLYYYKKKKNNLIACKI